MAYLIIVYLLRQNVIQDIDTQLELTFNSPGRHQAIIRTDAHAYMCHSASMS